MPRAPPGERDSSRVTSVGARGARSPRADKDDSDSFTRRPRFRRDETRAAALTVPRRIPARSPRRSSPPPQALVNCGHVYHLSCIHRWFNCKKDASARGGRRANAPPHAPCPKCKEPFDMGSTVTIYLDLPKGASTPRSAAKSKRRTPRAASVVPESPIDLTDDAVARPRQGTVGAETISGVATDEPLRAAFPDVAEELASLREETRAASARAREAEDALAAAEIRRDAELAEDRANDEDLARLERELARAKERLNEATFKEGQAVAKAARATEKLTEARTELQRLRGRVSALETQKKLERDLSDRNGAARSEAELAKRFGEGSGLDPRVAVETLCRALAGKNRQLHAQLEEYAKLTKTLRAAERARRSAEARAEATIRSNRGEAFGKEDDENDSRGGGSRARERRDDARVGDAFASRVSRGWGREGGARDDPEGAVLATGPSSGPSSSFPSAFGDDFSKRFAARTGLAEGRTSVRGRGVSHDLRGGGPLSRAPAVVKKRKRGKSGEDLLDDILGSVDANAAASKRRSAAEKSDRGFDLASLASLRRGDAPSDENDRADRQNVSPFDDAGKGGDGGSFIIHGADGRGGRAKIVRPGGGQSSLRVASGETLGASGSLDRFLSRG